LGFDVSLGGQTLESLDDLEVGNVEFLMLGGVEVLFGDKDTLCRIECRN